MDFDFPLHGVDQSPFVLRLRQLPVNQVCCWAKASADASTYRKCLIVWPSMALSRLLAAELAPMR